MSDHNTQLMKLTQAANRTFGRLVAAKVHMGAVKCSYDEAVDRHNAAYSAHREAESALTAFCFRKSPK